MDLANTTITRRRNCWFDVLSIQETGVNMMEPMDDGDKKDDQDDKDYD